MLLWTSELYYGARILTFSAEFLLGYYFTLQPPISSVHFTHDPTLKTPTYVPHGRPIYPRPMAEYSFHDSRL